MCKMMTSVVVFRRKELPFDCGEFVEFVSCPIESWVVTCFGKRPLANIP